MPTCEGAKWRVSSTGNWIKMCQDSKSEGLRKKRRDYHVGELSDIGEEILLKYKTISSFFLITA